MPRHPLPIAQQSRALSSVYGKIEQILVAIGGDYKNFEFERLDLFYQELFQKFSDRVSFVVMGHFGSGSEEALRRTLRQNGLDPDLVQVHTPLADPAEIDLHREQGVFVQDPFIVMESGHGETLLLEPYRAYLEQNAFVAEQFADATGYALLPTRYLLEGGNILVGDDYALIGRNLLERNRRKFYPDMPREEAESIITNDLKRSFGLRYLFWIGTEEEVDHPLREQWAGPEGLQPFYHIDLFLTLGGKSKAGDEIVLLAEIDTGSFDAAPTPEQEAALSLLNGLLKQVRTQLMQYSAKHPGPRFEIVEIPMSGTIAGAAAEISFTPYSYNNAQVEWYHGISRIYLPSFPLRRTLEDKLRENLQGLGFSRVEYIVYDMEQFAKRRGGLHCLTKVLRRGNY
ncbi:MAG: hypothetical protein U0176_05115 [Bacteroidia bacterium]